MIFRTMGLSGLKVSSLGLGSMNFCNKSWGCNDKDSAEIIESYLENGGNFIDTANYYTFGESEKIIGKVIGKKRDRLIISTKLGAPMDNPYINDRGSSRYNIIEAINGSLKRLGTDYIDLLYLHIWDPTTPILETLTSLTQLVRDGKVRYIGASNFTGWQISEFASIWKHNASFEPFVSMQSEYSLISRYIEYEIIPSCIYNGIGLVCYSPLGGGVLAGIYKEKNDYPKNERYTADDHWSNTAKNRYLSDKNLEIADKLNKIAKNLDISLSVLSLSWLLNKKPVSSVLIGARNSKQLIENMDAINTNLDSDVIKEMDEISEFFRPYEYDADKHYLNDFFKDIEYKRSY